MSLAERALAAGYDRLIASAERAGLAQRRRDLLGDLHGHVVEIGAGTGQNVDLYGPAVTRLTLLEPSTPMLRRLRDRVAASGRDVEVLGAPAEAMPLPDRSVDAVVSTLVLCTVGDPERAFDEVERVLRPGGRLALLEHVAGDGRTATLQRVLARPWRVVGQGCHLDRDPRAALAARGWDTAALVDVALPLPAPTRPGQVGTATRP